MSYEFDDYEYGLIFRPYEDDNGDNMHMAIGMYVPENDHPEEWRAMTILTMALLSTAFVMMNEDTEFYEILMQKLKELREKKGDGNHMDDFFEDEDEVSYEYVDEDKKVIQLNMFTKTKGSA